MKQTIKKQKIKPDKKITPKKRTYTLITGGAGFIGSHLAKALIRKGHSTIILDNLSTGQIANLPELNNKCIFFKGDVNNPETVQTVFQKYKIRNVFHYAATAGVIRTQQNPEQVLADIQGTINILQQSKEHNIRKVIFSSSSEVYGETDQKLTETLHEQPTQPYALVKYIGEFLMNYFNIKYNLKTTNLRFFNVYGPNQEGGTLGYVIPKFIEQSLTHQPHTIHDKGESKRAFVYIDDNIQASIEAMFQNTKTNGQTINIIQNPEITTMLQLSQKIRELTQDNTEPIFIEPKPGFIKNRIPNHNKYLQTFKYSFKTNLTEGLKKTIEHHKKQREHALSD